MSISRISNGGSWLLATHILLMCFGCRQPDPSQKGFAVDDPENVFFISRRKNFIMYEYNKVRDTLIAKAEFKDVHNTFLFYNAKLDKIYNFSFENIHSGDYGIRMYDRPNGRPKWFAERKTAYNTVYPYKDDYLIVASYVFPPEEQKNKLAIGDSFYRDPGHYSKAYLLETSEKGNRFTKEYDFYKAWNIFIQDSLVYSNGCCGELTQLNMATGEVKTMYESNLFSQNFFTDYDLEMTFPHFLTTPDSLPPPNQPLPVGNDMYMIPWNFVMGTHKEENQAREHLYSTYKINTLYKHIGNNKFELVLDVPMSEDVEWAIPMDEFIFFLGKEKGDQTELLQYNPVSKKMQQSILNTQGYFAYMAWRTKDYLVIILKNPKAKKNKHRLGIVPKDVTREPKFYDLPPDFDAANPYYFDIYSQYGSTEKGFIGNLSSRIIKYNYETIDSIMSGDPYYKNH